MRNLNRRRANAAKIIALLAAAGLNPPPPRHATLRL